MGDGEVLQSTNSAAKEGVITKGFSFIGREICGRGHGCGYWLCFKHFGTTQDVCNVLLLGKKYSSGSVNDLNA